MGVQGAKPLETSGFLNKILFNHPKKILEFQQKCLEYGGNLKKCVHQIDLRAN